MFMFWNYYVLKFLHLETLTFSDATLSDMLSDMNVVLCYVLSQYRKTQKRADVRVNVYFCSG
jgi:hypothetical protein